MLDFMIIGLPRSATTWVSNWLTTDHMFCLHDPLQKMHYTEWDHPNKYIPERVRSGVCCTGIWRWPDWVNAHPAKKLIICRDLKSVNYSLDNVGLGEMDMQDAELIDQIKGNRVRYESLFDIEIAQQVWEYLTNDPFSAHRYRALVEMAVQPKFDNVVKDEQLQLRLFEELTNEKNRIPDNS